jgi:hypothetical protein
LLRYQSQSVYEEVAMCYQVLFRAVSIEDKFSQMVLERLVCQFTGKVLWLEVVHLQFLLRVNQQHLCHVVTFA